MEYNKVIEVSDQVCLVDNGVFCQEWQNNTETTYPFASLVLLGQLALFLLVVRFFIRR